MCVIDVLIDIYFYEKSPNFVHVYNKAGTNSDLVFIYYYALHYIHKLCTEIVCEKELLVCLKSRTEYSHTLSLQQKRTKKVSEVIMLRFFFKKN